PRDARDPRTRTEQDDRGRGAEQPEADPAGGREHRADGERLGRGAAHDRNQPRLDEELFGRAGAVEEPQDAARDFDASHPSAERSRSEPAVGAPRRAGAAASGGSPGNTAA